MKTAIVLWIIGVFFAVLMIISGVHGTHETHYTLPDGSTLISAGRATITLNGAELPEKIYSDNDFTFWIGFAGFLIFALGGLIVLMVSDD